MSFDKTGRNRILSNVAWSWGGYILIFAIGFLMPRLINDFIGQARLGIWDFAWSVVSYLSLSSFGIGSSVNRYVSKFRASGDFNKLSETVNSVLAIQLLVATFIFLGALLFAWYMPIYFSAKLGDALQDAQIVLVILASAVAIQQLFHVFRGVITGCHRWDLHNFIEVFLRIISFLGIFFTLFIGYGLPGMALAYLASVIIVEACRFFIARRVCPEFHLGFGYVTWRQAKKMILFGWKTVLATLSPIILMQTTSIVVAKILGPSVLAVLSRALGLMSRTETFINRYSFITTPVASALQMSEDRHSLHKFIYETAAFVAGVVVPIVVIFLLCGGDILKIWMGNEYAKGATMAILALGYFFPLTQSPLLRIIIGLNMHGRLGILNILLCLAIFAITFFICQREGLTLNKAAILIALPMAIGNGLLIPLYAKFYLDLPLLDYFRKSLLIPLLASVPLSLVTASARILWPGSSLKILSIAFLGGVPLVVLCYWLFFWEKEFKKRIVHKVHRIGSRIF